MSIAENIQDSRFDRRNELSAFALQTTPALRSALQTNLGSSLYGTMIRLLVAQRLTAAVRNAREVSFDDTSRLVFFSDCHRGDSSRKDAFAANEGLFLRALDYYYQQNFTYFEVGDGDELWQNRYFRQILKSHRAVFDLLHRFDRQGRLHLITGNHDVPVRWQKTVNKDGIVSEDALMLRHRRTGQGILVTHGHQADIISDRLSPLSRLVVRYGWRYIQDWRMTNLFRSLLKKKVNLDGLSDDEVIARLLHTIEKRLMNWVDSAGQMIICGHTHRARAAVPGAPPYFNTGSFVVPGEATGLEIQGGEISLVRWTAHPVTREVHREILTPPRRLTTYI